jgi:NAD(P)-dependent dehydrogenase (short-subunit alcohol dehydrogenase family)
MHVKDNVCVVIGAASGIGEAVGRAYAQDGARGVVVADLKSSRGGSPASPATSMDWPSSPTSDRRVMFRR